MTILTVTLNPALDLTTDTGKGRERLQAPMRSGAARSGRRRRQRVARHRQAGRAEHAVRRHRRPDRRDAEVASGGSRASRPEWFADRRPDAAERRGKRAIERAAVPLRAARPGLERGAGRAFAGGDGGDARSRPGRSAAAYVVASGSLPPGLPDDFYNRIGELADRRAARFVLDTSGRMLDVAAHGGQHPPYAGSWTSARRNTSPAGRAGSGCAGASGSAWS